MPPISLWLNEETGLWQPEGEASYDAATGVFSAGLPHFSYHNVDHTYCVEDGSGDYATGVCEESRTDTVTCELAYSCPVVCVALWHAVVQRYPGPAR